jgi:DNA uptake protein ComE-like DNA-binding protein
MSKMKLTSLAAIIVLTFGAVAFATDTKKTENVVVPVAKTKLIDINTATEYQLKTIQGVGDEEAKRIIAGRPYYNKAELKTKKIINTDLYEKMKKLISAVC